MTGNEAAASGNASDVEVEADGNVCGELTARLRRMAACAVS